MPSKLFVLPTPDTRQYLETIFRDLPIYINYDALCVEVATSNTKIPTISDNVYRALPGALGMWYETATARSWILLPLIPSHEMCTRHEEVGDVWHRSFVPYLSLTSDFNNTSRMKSRFNSIATGLVDRLPVLEFWAETCVTDNAVVPGQKDFHEDYTRNSVPRTYDEALGG